MDAQLAIKVGDSADAELAGAMSVEVCERMGEPTTFRLRYPVDITESDLPILADARLDPGSEIQVLAVIDGLAECLVKGPIHGQQIHFVHGGAGSYVEIIGSDTSITMDREVKAAAWDGVKDSDVVSTIVAGYGLLPDVDDTEGSHEEAKHTLIQRDSDLGFVRRLARRNGCLFWVDADPLGVQTAHFKRPPIDGEPEQKLIINLDDASLGSLDITWDVERPTSSECLQLDLADKSDLDGGAPRSPLRVLGDVGLFDITGDVRSTHIVAPVDDVGDLRSRGEGALIESDWFVRATGSTSLAAAGALLRAHRLVEVQGLGKRHSGPWFVAGVRHVIKDAAYRMEFELVRNGWGA